MKDKELLERLAATVAEFVPTVINFDANDSDPDARCSEVSNALDELLSGFKKGLDGAEPDPARRQIIREAISNITGS